MPDTDGTQKVTEPADGDAGTPVAGLDLNLDVVPTVLPQGMQESLFVFKVRS